MQTFLLLLSCLTVAPHAARQEAPAPVAAPAPASITLQNDMTVVSSDGVAVAKTIHIRKPNETFAPDKTFFTNEERWFVLRRIYAREAWVDGDKVRLRMTAKQFRARMQNPPQ